MSRARRRTTIPVPKSPIDEPLCDHSEIFTDIARRVTNLRDNEPDEGREWRCVWVCPRRECIDKAINFVQPNDGPFVIYDINRKEVSA